MKKLILAALMGLTFSQVSSAGVITWTDWQSAVAGSNGSASGTIGSVGVSYTGDVTFAQLGTGRNYWTEGDPAPYTGNSVIDNAPTASEMIAMSLSGITNTITFSETVINPIITIVSQGQLGRPVTYDFDTAFTVLSEGRGYWGDGSYTEGPGDTLEGRELHAAIQFNGAVNSLSWTAAPGEYWHGITVGLGQQLVAVSEPASIALLALGLIGFTRRKVRV